MIKTLTALAAITVCCLGNDYPAKAHHLSNPFPSGETGCHSFDKRCLQMSIYLQQEYIEDHSKPRPRNGYTIPTVLDRYR